jgi:hypothetical protein
MKNDVSEERSASIISVTRIGKEGTTLAVTSNRCPLRLLVTANVFLVPWFWSPWWLRRYVPPRRRFLQEPHGVTFQKTAFFIVTAVKIPNLTEVTKFDSRVEKPPMLQVSDGLIPTQYRWRNLTVVLTRSVCYRFARGWCSRTEVTQLDGRVEVQCMLQICEGLMQPNSGDPTWRSCWLAMSVSGVRGSDPRIYVRRIQRLWWYPTVHSERSGGETQERTTAEGRYPTEMLSQALQSRTDWVTQHPSSSSFRAPAERTHLCLPVPHMCSDRLYTQFHQTGTGLCLQWLVRTWGINLSTVMTTCGRHGWLVDSCGNYCCLTVKYTNPLSSCLVLCPIKEESLKEQRR